MAPSPPPSLTLGAIALGVVVLLPLLWLSSYRAGSFYTLGGSMAVFLVLLVVAICQWRRTRLRAHLISIVVSTCAGTIPLLTFILFTVVFVIGRSSNVAQMADHSGFNYWGMWFGAWPFLLFGNPVCIILSVISLACPPYHLRFVASWALPLACMIAAAAATNIAVVYFPDA